MASIKKLLIKKRTVWRVFFAGIKGNVTKDFRCYEKAAQQLFLAEALKVEGASNVDMETFKPFRLRKLIDFYVGYQYDKLCFGHIGEKTFDEVMKRATRLEGDIMNMPVNRISPAMLRGAFSSDYDLYFLHKAYNVGMEYRLTNYNPCPQLHRKSKPKKPPTPEVVRKIFDLAEPREKVFIYLAGVLGLRISEIMPLEFGDITSSEVTVNKHIVLNNKLYDGDKCGRYRDIDVDEELKRLIDQVPKYGKYIFANHKTGAFLTINAYRNNHLTPLFAKAGAHLSVAPHHLRHYAISFWIKSKQDLKIVQQRAGHASLAVTTRVYSHLVGKPTKVERSF